jgi:hypothetical protein
MIDNDNRITIKFNNCWKTLRGASNTAAFLASINVNSQRRADYIQGSAV